MNNKYFALAHPGNTASDGCHYCWTNCESWGEVYGQRHCHGYVPEPSYEPEYVEPDPEYEYEPEQFDDYDYSEGQTTSTLDAAGEQTSSTDSSGQGAESSWFDGWGWLLVLAGFYGGPALLVYLSDFIGNK